MPLGRQKMTYAVVKSPPKNRTIVPASGRRIRHLQRINRENHPPNPRSRSSARMKECTHRALGIHVPSGSISIENCDGFVPFRVRGPPDVIKNLSKFVLISTARPNSYFCRNAFLSRRPRQNRDEKLPISSDGFIYTHTHICRNIFCAVSTCFYVSCLPPTFYLI